MVYGELYPTIQGMLLLGRLPGVLLGLRTA